MTTTVYTIRPEGAAERMALLLSSPEAERVSRFRDARDRDSLAAAHGMKRAILGAMVGAAPKSLVFQEGPEGKPALDGPGPAFSLSHSRAMAVLAVSDDGDVGVDVESLARSVPDIGRMAGAVFDAEERAQIARLEPASAARHFLRTFVLKEAVVKATGLGLPQGLSGFGVSVAPPALVRGDIHTGDGSSWSLHLFERDGHAIGLAIHGAAPNGAVVDCVGRTVDDFKP